jgi:hypothetical protein
MANAAKAFKKFSKSSALLGLIGGHQFLMKDDIPDLINKHTDPQSVQGLKFLQRHYDELVQGDEKSGILLEEIESWRKR